MCYLLVMCVFFLVAGEGGGKLRTSLLDFDVGGFGE